ncbi:MAG: hypothetical protein KJO82_05290 [Gammaproteobacteria bacterium]|nr:hypothetical protein [Gammaproteobacteria bacterium]
MKSCAYLTMTDPGDYVMDYELSFEPMATVGWQAVPVEWRDTSVDWNDFDAVYVCTPWDYPEHADEFMQLMRSIDKSSALLVNPLPLIRWSLSKEYLRDLENRGAAIVPSLWFDSFDGDALTEAFRTLASDRLVIKPAIGANAKDAFVLERPVDDALSGKLGQLFKNRAYFLQPFIASIETEGEYSVFCFSGEYSHAILKTPKPGDFRSQEEHGSEIRSVVASPALREASDAVLSLVEPQPVYVRADFVRDADDEFLLMELELIEPALYFRMDPTSPVRFAKALDRYYQSHNQ